MKFIRKNGRAIPIQEANDKLGLGLARKGASVAAIAIGGAQIGKGINKQRVGLWAARDGWKAASAIVGKQGLAAAKAAGVYAQAKRHAQMGVTIMKSGTKKTLIGAALVGLGTLAFNRKDK